ncbi:MAG TPA: hypothetical protein VFH27_00340 [Longimicrobiaceae bacterium]|nr:hypothetical protein [Longimicrobiaceae bacterium]
MFASDLRPLSFGEILDGAFTLYRRHFSTLALTSLMAQLPLMAVYVLQALVARPGMEGAVATMLVTLLVIPAAAFAYGLGRPALVRQASNAYLSEPVSREDGFAVGRTRFWTMLITGILYVIAVWLGFLFFIVPFFLLNIMFFASDQVVTLEGAMGPDALSRSAVLAKGAWGRIAGLWTVVSLIVYMPVMALGIGGILMLSSLTSTLSPGDVTAATAAIQVGGALVGALVQPLMVVAMTLQYYDRRVRTEALDLAPPPAAAMDAPPAFA